MPMQSSDFVHLHCHSTYSLLEALPSPEEIVLRAKELGQTAVGIADKGYTYSLIEFAQAADKHGLQPILGLETYIAARSRHDKEAGIDTKRYPLVLLAETQEGYENLLQLATAAALEGMYYKPRVDAELLSQYGKGLIALTGPISGQIPQAALAEDAERIKALTEQYTSWFGTGNVYFELMDLPQVPGQAELNQQLIRYSKELPVPLVATCNSHYCQKEDTEAHDVLLCIQKNAKVDDPNRFSMRDSDFSMRPFEELEKAFAHVPEALLHTKEIADRCNVSFKDTTISIPRFPVPKGKTETSLLRKLCEKGLKERHGRPTNEQKERLEHELKIIEQMGFSSYFLIVWDFVSEAKRRGITVGPGRGSVAGSMVSYCLNITNLNPLEHGLIFERFLNPERISMPDIDTDFADTRRDEVLEYVRERYGQENVVQICTFGTLAARAAVKDVGRVYGIPFMEMNALAKLISDRPGTSLTDALQTDELKGAVEKNPTYKKITDAALKLEGKARHVSVHACGVIITPKPTVTYTALQRAPKDEHTIITQYHAKPLETLGLLKMDFLGLTNLTVIQTTLAIIERTRGKEIDIQTIPPDDKRAFRLLQNGDTTGVFQLESGGMRRYLKKLKPTSFNDITAMAALYRPGPMEWIPSYIKRKHGKETVRYIHPDLKKIFEETYGIGVYQEQILELARQFAGFSLGEADLLRKAIGKKIAHELKAQKEKFIEGAKKKGYENALAQKVFKDVILPFAGYGFPKAHAACYARIAYETAYLKAHYPAEFMAALLSSDAQKTDRVMIEIDECRSMSIPVLPPDINESLRNFTVVESKGSKNAIRFGLAAIKGMGESSVDKILSVREAGEKFSTIEDFARRIPPHILNKKLIESLAKSGALDTLGDRRQLIDHYETIVTYGKESGDISQEQQGLFSTLEGGLDEAVIAFPQTQPLTQQEKLAWEKETLGLYVSSHPLAGLKKYIGKKAQLISNLTTKDVGKTIITAGIKESLKLIRTKKGESMAIVTIEDPTGKIEVTLFPRIYSHVTDILEQPDTVLVARGTLDYRAGQLQLRAHAIKRAPLSTMIERAKREGFFDEEEAAQGILPTKKLPAFEQDVIEAIDEEGNVIAGETITLEEHEEEDDFLGPLGKWLASGMDTKGLTEVFGPSTKTEKKADKGTDGEDSNVSEALPKISIHTVKLPERAPKKLLLDIKKIFETFPGKERVQIKVGSKCIPLPLTISMSTILQKKVEDILKNYIKDTDASISISSAPIAEETEEKVIISS